MLVYLRLKHKHLPDIGPGEKMKTEDLALSAFKTKNRGTNPLYHQEEQNDKKVAKRN